MPSPPTPDPKTANFTAKVPALLAELEQRARTLFGLDLTPDLTALPALEQIADFLWTMCESFSEEDHRINILLLGTYLGETIRRTQGGQWRVDTSLGVPLVMLPEGQFFDPMAAVQQRLETGGPPLTGSANIE